MHGDAPAIHRRRTGPRPRRWGAARDAILDYISVEKPHCRLRRRARRADFSDYPVIYPGQ